MFRRTPPSADSAETAVASIVISCVALMFGVYPVSNVSFAQPVESPLRFIRKSVFWPPWMARIVVVSPPAPPTSCEPRPVKFDCADGSHHARNQHTEARRQAARGQRISDLLTEDALLSGALHVDGRRFSGNGDGLFHPSDTRSAFTVAMNEPVSSIAFAAQRVEKPPRENTTV